LLVFSGGCRFYFRRWISAQTFPSCPLHPFHVLLRLNSGFAATPPPSAVHFFTFPVFFSFFTFVPPSLFFLRRFPLMLCEAWLPFFSFFDRGRRIHPTPPFFRVGHVRSCLPFFSHHPGSVERVLSEGFFASPFFPRPLQMPLIFDSVFFFEDRFGCSGVFRPSAFSPLFLLFSPLLLSPVSYTHFCFDFLLLVFGRPPFFSLPPKSSP